MFNWFETRTQPFPDTPLSTPPKDLFSFCCFYTKGFEIPLILMAILSAITAAGEVLLLRYIGDLVDILTIQDRATFWQN